MNFSTLLAMSAPLNSNLLRLQAIFRDVFLDPSICIVPETSPKELSEWDSVAQVNIVLAVELEFNFRFTTNEIVHIRCAGDFLDVIEAHSAH